MAKRPKPRNSARPDNELRDLEERFQLFIDNVKDYAIFMTDASGRIVSWNAGVERLLGYTEAEFIGQRLSAIFVPEDVSSGAAAREVAAASETGRSEDERWHRRKDGSRFWASGVLTALRDERQQLRGFAKVMRDITDRKRAEEERKELLQHEQAARKEAQAAARVRDQFLAMVSHELRTPLNAILGWARLLEEQQFEPERARRAMDTIRRNAVLQAKLIDDLLDVSRTLAGTLTMDRRDVDLTSLVHSTVDSLSPQARAKHVTIEHRLPVDAWVVGDSRRLHQVVANLLSNAIKFTPEGGHVSMAIDKTGGKAVLAVQDTGVGIPPEFLPQVFEPFSQADMTIQRKHGGLGLGLSIARHLVDQHGGTISADSQGVGRGATFTVELPLSPGPAEAPVERLPAADVMPTLESVLVLVVENDADSRELLVVALELAGASVIQVTSVVEAFRAIAMSTPDVIVCDIGLPEVDGFAFMKRLRTFVPEAGGTIPAAAITAYTRPEDRRLALEAGYEVYLPKPVEPSELVAAVARLAGKVAN